MFWSGNEVKEKRGTITNEQESTQRCLTAARVAQHLRGFQPCLFEAGHHADLYGRPSKFDAHVADVRLSLEIIGVSNTEAPRIA